ncbi:MAG: helix-turn-helix transcriptional regulator [Candidatus Liptonbacteria bacterium]|nr:helix-turn-helix transcriptional regulator [Candidatus Liptonbacteria bacterium]
MTTTAKISNGVKSPFPKTTYERNAEIYKILANPKRLEILNILKKYGERTVEQLIEILSLPKANVSQHLALLRHARLVTVRRDGLNANYTITDPRIVEPCRILRELWKNK